MKLGYSIPIVISVISILISLIVAYGNAKYYEVNIRYASRNHYMTVLFELDKQLINNPKLWAVYDTHPLSSSKLNETPEEKAKREAFIWFHFNLFESVFNDYNNVIKLTKVDSQFWESWKSNIELFLGNSLEARKLFKDSFSQRIFIKDYVTFMNEIIKKVEMKTDNLIYPNLV